jgi:hypothetical protein
MQKIFVESDEFTKWVSNYLTHDDLVALQRMLLKDPESGKVMSGCGGMRKLRIADRSRGKGKRGGARVIYLHIEELDQIHFITIYGKDERDDVSDDDKKVYRKLVEALKKQAKRSKRS